MLSAMVHQAQAAAARTARGVALGVGGALCLGVGLSFLTVAAWLYLTSVTTPLQAATIIGCFYSGFGLLLIVIGSRRKPHHKAVPHHAYETSAATGDAAIANVIAAFMTGVAAGRKARS